MLLLKHVIDVKFTGLGIYRTRGKNANYYTTDTTLEARMLIITLLIPHSRQEC